MNPPTADQNFEKFRRERRQRRAQFGGVPATAPRSAGIKDVEAYEARQVHETRLSREVHDFLAQATKQAAAIVEKVTQAAEAESSQRLVREMHDFLEETVRRAAKFMQMVQAQAGGAAVRDLETHVSNIVGTALDEFRFEGTAQLADKHIGQDPFLEPLPPAAASDDRTDAENTEDDMQKNTNPAGARTGDTTAPAGTLDGKELLLERVCRDADTLKRALKALVQVKVLTQDEARSIYKSALQEA
jgi:hypothetical protein